MYRADHSSKDADYLAAHGLRPEDYTAAEKTLEIWPDNWSAVQIFSALGTQWRPGFAGPAGLDYSAVITYLRECGMTRAKRQEMLSLIQVMEVEALEQMRLNRD